MNKLFTVALLLLTTTACTSVNNGMEWMSGDSITQVEKRAAKHAAKCSAFGFEPGTLPHTQCVFQLETRNRDVSAAMAAQAMQAGQ